MMIEHHTLDDARLRRDCRMLYAGTPPYMGMEHAERVLGLAARLCGPDHEPGEALRLAALLHDTGRPGVPDRLSLSLAMTRSYLLGAGYDIDTIETVARTIDAIGWDGRGDHDLPATEEGLILWHADRLDLLSVPRHVQYLAATPARDLSPEAHWRAHLTSYKEDYLIPAVTLRPLLRLPASIQLFDDLFPFLARFLDDLAAGALDCLPPELHQIAGEAGGDHSIWPDQNWRRLGELPQLRASVHRLLAGEDAGELKREAPAPGPAYREFRTEQRNIIRRSQDAILRLTRERIAAAERVAAEKYFVGDTLHKPSVEHDLFRVARQRGTHWGLSPDTAEDITRLLLAKAREAQERVYNEIAATLAQRHKQLLRADAPEAQGGEADGEIPPLVVRSGDQVLAREDELIKEFRLTGLNEEHPAERAALLHWFAKPHHYLVKGLIAGSRDSDLFLQALSAGEPCVVIAPVPLSPRLHLGHAAQMNLLAYFQELGATIAPIFDGFGRQDGERSDPLNEHDETQLWLHHAAACGLEIDRIEAASLRHDEGIIQLAFELGSLMPVRVLNSAFGLRMNESVTRTFLPLIQVAGLLSPQGRERRRTLVLAGLQSDIDVRMARSIAGDLGLIKPAALYLRAVKNLAHYVDPSIGAPLETMTSQVPRGAIFLDDTPEEARRKIARAMTGGARDLAAQRVAGGNPDPRVCSVSSLHAFYGIPDPAEYAQIKESCRSGRLPCRDCKQLAIERISAYLREHASRQNTGGAERPSQDT